MIWDGPKVRCHVKSNKGLRVYRHQQANNKVQQRHKDKPKAVKLAEEVKFIICICLRCEWSPEQIAGRFKRMDRV